MIKMAIILKYDAATIDKILDGRYHSPIEDIAGDNYTEISPLTITGGNTEQYVCNNNIREFSSFPAHVSKMWDTANNKAIFAELLDTPMIVGVPSFIWKPASSTDGKITVGVYVNETSPILIEEQTLNYKGTARRVSPLFTFYIGEDAGFDVKNKGVIYRITPDTTGDLYLPIIKHYRT